MAFDSNTKVALLRAEFSKILLFSFSALSLSNNPLVYDLLEDLGVLKRKTTTNN